MDTFSNRFYYGQGTDLLYQSTAFITVDFDTILQICYVFTNKLLSEKKTQQNVHIESKEECAFMLNFVGSTQYWSYDTEDTFESINGLKYEVSFEAHAGISSEYCSLFPVASYNMKVFLLRDYSGMIESVYEVLNNYL